MNKVYLSLNEKDLGYLVEGTHCFKFVADKDVIAHLEEENPLAMLMFKLNKCGEQEYEYIPAPFSRFLAAKNRKDIIEKADIKETDSQFDCLYKLAGLDMMEINFKIHQ